jgi:uncharacterized protein YegP (UPF0339 family)
MKGFDFYLDTAGEWRWRLKDGNHEIVADSGEGYKQRADCVHGSELFKTLGPDAPEREAQRNDTKGQGREWEYYEDDAQEWRWRFQANNNKVIADGAEGYDSKYNVKRAITNVKALLRELGGGTQGGGNSSGGGNSGGGYLPPVPTPNPNVPPNRPEPGPRNPPKPPGDRPVG